MGEAQRKGRREREQKANASTPKSAEIKEALGLHPFPAFL